MKDVLLAAMPREIDLAERLAAAMSISVTSIEVDVFPDRETRVLAPKAANTTILYCSLNNPNEKLVPLMLAASALRDLGAQKIILAAPYLCYMRQDKAFREGEAVSQRVLSKILSPWVDHIVTIEPHLHRAKDLRAVFPHIKATALSAAPLLAAYVETAASASELLLIGPDEEARSWTNAVAEASSAPYAIMSKHRRGDRDVRIELLNETEIEGKHIILVDDVVSSGATLVASAELLHQRGAARIDALTVHALCSTEDLRRIKSAGVSRIISTNSVPHETNEIDITPLLANALLQELDQ